MDLLVTLRALTLVARLFLVAAVYRVVRHRSDGSAVPERLVWIAVAGQYTLLAITTVMVEALWLLRAIWPASPLFATAKALYNPAYLFNATINALVPFLVTAWLTPVALGRRLAQIGACGVVAIAFAALVVGAARDWTTLMSWTQVLAFIEVGCYLVMWGLILLGHVSRVSPYLMGLLAAAGLFAVLMPIQAEFFELVGRNNARQIWHLNQALQFVEVAVELSIVLAYMNSTAPRKSASLVAQELGLGR